MNNITYSNLRFARENFGYTVRSLGEVIQMNPSTLSKYENGRRGLPSEIIKILADTLNCSCDFIMQESDYGLYAYHSDKKVVISIKQYNELENNGLIKVVDYKRIIDSSVSDDILTPLTYGIK